VRIYSESRKHVRVFIMRITSCQYEQFTLCYRLFSFSAFIWFCFCYVAGFVDLEIVCFVRVIVKMSLHVHQ